MTFQEAFIQEVLLHGLEMDELPAFVDHQDLVHRIVHHAVREEQDHRDGHPAENEYQPGAQRIALPGFYYTEKSLSMLCILSMLLVAFMKVSLYNL